VYAARVQYRLDRAMGVPAVRPTLGSVVQGLRGSAWGRAVLRDAVSEGWRVR